MDKDSQELFDKLVNQDPSSLNTEEMKFLMGRRDYMTSEQKKNFAEQIKAHEAGKLFSEEETDLSKMTVAQLKAFAKENDIDLGGATGKGAILEIIEEELN